MSSTTRLLGAALLALAGWLAVLALAVRLGAPAPSALVVLPPDALLARLPPGAAVTDENALGLVVRGADAAALYAAGAPLVLPAGLAGCLGLSPNLRS